MWLWYSQESQFLLHPKVIISALGIWKLYLTNYLIWGSSSHTPFSSLSNLPAHFHLLSFYLLTRYKVSLFACSGSRKGDVQYVFCISLHLFWRRELLGCIYRTLYGMQEILWDMTQTLTCMSVCVIYVIYTSSLKEEWCVTNRRNSKDRRYFVLLP